MFVSFTWGYKFKPHDYELSDDQGLVAFKWDQFVWNFQIETFVYW